MFAAFRHATIALISAPGLFFQVGGASAIEVAFRAPVDCVGGTEGCESDISLAEARARASAKALEVEKCLEWKRKASEEKERIQAEAAKKAESVKKMVDELNERRRAQGLPIELIPPSPPEIPTLRFEPSCEVHASTADARSCEEGAGDAMGLWATVAMISKGQEAFAALQEHARKGLPFGENFVIVEATESPPHEQHLALCVVRSVEGVAGPPRDCATVAVITASETFLRAESFDFPFLGCLQSSTIRLGGSVDIDFEIQTAVAVEKFSESLSDLLRKDLGFTSERKVYKSEAGVVQSVDFRSTTGLRESPILEGGWREALDLDLHIRVAEAGRIEVFANAKPMVCRTASGATSEYHGPDDAQKTTYAKFLNARINGAITRVCTAFSQVDDKNIVCQ